MVLRSSSSAIDTQQPEKVLLGLRDKFTQCLGGENRKFGQQGFNASTPVHALTFTYNKRLTTSLFGQRKAKSRSSDV